MTLADDEKTQRDVERVRREEAGHSPLVKAEEEAGQVSTWVPPWVWVLFTVAVLAGLGWMYSCVSGSR